MWPAIWRSFCALTVTLLAALAVFPAQAQAPLSAASPTECDKHAGTASSDVRLDGGIDTAVKNGHVKHDRAAPADLDREIATAAVVPGSARRNVPTRSFAGTG